MMGGGLWRSYSNIGDVTEVIAPFLLSWACSYTLQRKVFSGLIPKLGCSYLKVEKLTNQRGKYLKLVPQRIILHVVNVSGSSGREWDIGSSCWMKNKSDIEADRHPPLQQTLPDRGNKLLLVYFQKFIIFDFFWTKRITKKEFQTSMSLFHRKIIIFIFTFKNVRVNQWND